MSNNVLTLFGKRLREVRKEKGLSQEVLADTTGFDRTYISLLERGKRNPSLLTIFYISRALEVPLKTFIDPLDKADKR